MFGKKIKLKRNYNLKKKIMPVIIVTNVVFQVIGVSFHVGTFCKDPPAYVKGIELARDVFDNAKSLGFNFQVLDIGGGFPGDNNTSIVDVMTFNPQSN